MKRSISVAVLLSLFITASIPGFAQNSARDERFGARPDRTTFGTVEAFTDGFGVLVRWQMAIERRNVGFNVYRVTSGEEERINQTMVLGSSARAGSETTRGDTYYSFDSNGGFYGAYRVYAIGLDGQQIMSRIASVRYVKDLREISGHSADEWLLVSDSSNRRVTSGTMDLEPELADEVLAYLQAPDLTMHRWVVNQPGAKIAVREEGLHRVSSSELLAVGFDTTGDSTKWRLFANGVEQAIIVGPGNQYIEFYGKPIDTVESNTRVYYLITGEVDGKRMRTRVARPSAGTITAPNYPVTSLLKERNSYVNTIINGPAENYWGRMLTSDPSTLPFTLTGVTSTGNVDLQFRLQAFSVNNHLLRVRINGNLLPEQAWTGQTPYSFSVNVPASFLAEGTNSLEMSALAAGDFILFDSIEVKFQRRYQAQANTTSFFTFNSKRADVAGFTSANIRIFDTTHDGDPVLLLNVPIVQEGQTFTAKLPAARGFVGYALENTAVIQSPQVTRNNPSNYSTRTDRADLIIISHGASDFMEAAGTWADYRRGQGFHVLVVDVADIFDEFNYGSLSADSIKAFLEYTYTEWTVPPSYVMLIGDATHDPKNYESFGYWDLVPSKNVSLILEESSSDEALADFDGDGLAEMAIGRISARNVANVHIQYKKTTTFEENSGGEAQDLTRGAIFAYDLPFGFDFQSMCVQLKDELPEAVPSFMIGRGDPDAGTTLVNEMNNGRYIANYCGHGSVGLWAAGSFFANSSVPLLTNADHPTIYTMLTCLNGYFVLPASSFDSLAESLNKWPNGGAVASWASTARTFPDIQLAMGKRFYGQLAEGNIARLGDLVRDAKTSIPAGADVRLSWVLLGDPMLRAR